MALMRAPVYAWIGGVCPDGCPDGGEGVVWGECTRPEHETVHLWVREGQEGTFDPVWYRTDGGSVAHPGFVSGVAVRGDIFDRVVAAYVAMRERDARRAAAGEGGPRVVPDAPLVRVGWRGWVGCAAVAVAAVGLVRVRGDRLWRI